MLAVFEEQPLEFVARAANFGLDLKTALQNGKLGILYLRPLDLSVDEIMQEILDAVEKISAKRLVIDSLAGFEMALAPGFRADFRESLNRLMGALTAARITVLSTAEIGESFVEFPFCHYRCSGQTLSASVYSCTRTYRGQLHGIWRCGVRLCMRSALRVFV